MELVRVYEGKRNIYMLVENDCSPEGGNTVHPEGMYYVVLENSGDSLTVPEAIAGTGTILFGMEQHGGADFYENAVSYVSRYSPKLLWISNPRDSYTKWNCRSLADIRKPGVLRFGEYRFFTGKYEQADEAGFWFAKDGGWQFGSVRLKSERVRLDYRGRFYLDAKPDTVSADTGVPEQAKAAGHETATEPIDWIEGLFAGICYTIPWKGEGAQWRDWKKECYSPVLHGKGCTENETIEISISPHAPFDSKRTYFKCPAGNYESEFISRIGRAVQCRVEEGELFLVLEKRCFTGYSMGLEGSCIPLEKELILGTCGTEYVKVAGRISFHAHQEGLLENLKADSRENNCKDRSGTDLQEGRKAQTTTSWISFDGTYYSASRGTTFFGRKEKAYLEEIPVPYAQMPGTPGPVFCWKGSREAAETIERTEKVLYERRIQCFTENNIQKQMEEEPVLSVTIQGMVAQITGGRINWLGLAQSLEGDIPDLRLYSPSHKLQHKILEKEAFFLFRSPEELNEHAKTSVPFSMRADVWEMHMEPDQWQADTILILKYTEKQSVYEYLKDDEGFRNIYEGVYDNKGQVKKGYEGFVNHMNDAGFTGVVFLNGRASVSQWPEGLETVMRTVDMEKLLVPYMFIKRNRITGKELRMKKSDVDALILYEDPEKLVSSGAASEPDYRLKTTSLFVRIENTAVTEFRSTTELLINRLWGTKVSGSDGENGNCLVILGVLRDPENSGGYQFALQQPICYFLEKSCFEKICIRNALLDSKREEGVVSLSGEIYFTEWEGCDLLAYGGEEGLPFRELYLLPAKGDALRADLSNILLEGSRSAMRAASVPEAFGAAAAEILVENQGKTPEDYGFSGIQAPVSQGLMGGAWTGIRWKYTFGLTGELGDGTAISFELLTAWGVRDGSLNYYVGISEKFNDGFGLEGILGVGFSSVSLIRQEGGRFVFLLHQFALKLLSMNLPFGNADIYLFGAGGKTGWYAAYVKEENT